MAAIPLLLLALLLLPVREGCSAEMVRRLHDESIAALAERILPEGSETAHPPVEVAISSSPGAQKAVVVLSRKKSDVDTNFKVWVLDPSGPSEYRKLEAPPMAEIPGHFEIEVLSVFGAKSAAVGPVLVVLYHYYRNGSGNDEGYASYVYRHRGDELIVEPGLSKAVVGLKTAAAVRSRLMQRTSPEKKQK